MRKKISHYKIQKSLGKGGMGEVFLAEDTRLKRPVALKLPPAGLTEDQQARQRFIQEARAASALEHPNICTIHEINQTQAGQLFIAMAYYDGETLKQKMVRGELAVDVALDIAIQITRGLAKAHEQGIIHRDIKPANIMITSEGIVKILDFGVAKLAGQTGVTKTGMVMGTVTYMSPEQARGAPLDHRSDIFSLGILLYEMLAGHPPFTGDNDQVILYSLLNETPPQISPLPKSVSGNMSKILNKCLNKDPDERYQNMAELQGDLKKIRQVPDTPENTHSSNRYLRRWITPLASIFILLLLVLLLPPVIRQVNQWRMGTNMPEEKHLAVLPFTSIGKDSLHHAFCDGLVETINSKITQIEQFQGKLWVVPATEIRNSGIRSVENARKTFGVNLVVTGSVQHSENEIRLAMNLVDTKKLRQVNSVVVDFPLANLSTLQDKVVRQLAEMLEIELQPPEMNRLTRGSTSQSEAYILYLQGRGYLHRFEKTSNIDFAIDLFHKAIQQDSSYALAYAALGEAYWRKYETTRETKWTGFARSYSQQALQIDPDLGPAHTTLGIVKLGTGQYDTAIREFRAALERSPSNEAALRGLAQAYEAKGDFESAESTYRQAAKLKPDYWAGYNYLGVFYYRQGRYEEAVSQFRKVVQLTPDNIRGYNNLGGIYLYLERWSEAEEIFNQALRIRPDYVTYVNLGNLYFLHKQQYGNAAKMFEKALKLNSSDYRIWASLASAYWSVQNTKKANWVYERAIRKAEADRKINPQNATVLSHLASFYAMTEQREKAEQLVNLSLKYAPEAVEVLARAAETYEKLGQRKKALECVKKALEGGYPLEHVQNTPMLQQLRKDTRFIKIIDRFNRRIEK